MIICASRRTDICAFHSGWFMGRIRAGYVLVRNPAYRRLVTKVPLDPDSVDHIDFITKNASPMLEHLRSLQSEYSLSFQYTITPYGRDLEPNVPSVEDSVSVFRKVSDIIGSDRILWRYDPMVITGRYDVSRHISDFGRMCSMLEGYTERCVTSFVKRYDKTEDAMCALGITVPDPAVRKSMVSEMSDIAADHGMVLSYCCPEDGIAGTPCLDPGALRRWGVPYTMPSVPNRSGCGCAYSVDIGDYDTCMHDCAYCYANGPDRRGRSGRVYSEDGEMLCGGLTDGDILKDTGPSVQTRLFRCGRLRGRQD
ncbi:MAG: DUF1848 domain-containing protein [Candidatus Methanomethylophilaceae archaeon]